jgi:hypothetical protein
MIRHGMDGSQNLPRSSSARVIGEAHVQPEQRSFGDSTRGEAICHRIEPPLGTIMENMRAQRERDEDIAIEQARFTLNRMWPLWCIGELVSRHLLLTGSCWGVDGSSPACAEGRPWSARTCRRLPRRSLLSRDRCGGGPRTIGSLSPLPRLPAPKARTSLRTPRSRLLMHSPMTGRGASLQPLTQPRDHQRMKRSQTTKFALPR